MQHSSISNVAERQFLIIFIGFYDFLASDILIDSRINLKNNTKNRTTSYLSYFVRVPTHSTQAWRDGVTGPWSLQGKYQFLDDSTFTHYLCFTKKSITLHGALPFSWALIRVGFELSGNFNVVGVVVAVDVDDGRVSIWRLLGLRSLLGRLPVGILGQRVAELAVARRSDGSWSSWEPAFTC